MAADEANGNVLAHRVGALEKAQETDREGVKLLAEFGRKNNDQILRHDDRLDGIDSWREDVNAVLEKLGDRQTTLEVEQGKQGTKLTFYAGVGSLIGGGIVTLLIALVSGVLG